MPDPFLSDAMSVDFERIALRAAVKGDRRQQLEAIRDYIADQLENNMCTTCKASKLRTGDQASLILRLQTVLGELEAIPAADAVDRLASVRQLHALPSVDPATQRRSGSRRPGAGRHTGDAS